MQYKNKAYFEDIIHRISKIGYKVEVRLLNAADHGVPQRRERIFVVGHNGKFKFPEKERTKVTAGEALRELPFTAPPESKFLTPGMDLYIAKYEKASYCINPRDLNLNSTSRTLTCRNLAAPTGDMMRIKLPDGRRRRLLIREAARLQSFPDSFKFCGNEESIFYQIGNAVPPLLSYKLAKSIRDYLEKGALSSSSHKTQNHSTKQKYLFEQG
jgi:DNA (cytosine-5)-methyltransferase 1